MESVGRYRLLRLLGEGALGLVYEAAGEDGAIVAVKVLRPEWAENAAARARFLREARLAARIESRHVVPVLEVGESYLVLPYYPRGSLAQQLREDGKLSLDRTVRLAAELGRGLDALHEHEILHRDVKPSNVLLADDGTAALSDFGLARASDSTQITQDGQLVGTPHYLAPELIEGGEATRASDLYALGCLLYECLVGEPPFTGARPAEIGFAHLAQAPPDPRERRPELSEDVALALLAALEKDPQARPTSGTALARMLHVACSASPA
jgi:eukaryotic-like serine/threonine-protein kinase